MPIGSPIDLTDWRGFFAKPATPSQRQYEALRAYFLEGLSSAEAAERFGYTPAAFRMLCYEFRRGELPEFFAVRRPGPREQPKKGKVRDQVIGLRKRNYSIYDISRTLKEEGTPIGATAVREILLKEGFAALPRRLDFATRTPTSARAKSPRRSSASSSSGRASTASRRGISSSIPSSPPSKGWIGSTSRVSSSSRCAGARRPCSR